jgi:hypothetical protein
VLEQLLEQEVRALGPFLFDDGGQRVHPFTGFLGIDVRTNIEGRIRRCGHRCVSGQKG